MVGIENRRTAAGHHDGRVTSGTSAVLRLRGGPVGNFARAASKLVAVVGSRRHGLRHGPWRSAFRQGRLRRERPPERRRRRVTRHARRAARGPISGGSLPSLHPTPGIDTAEDAGGVVEPRQTTGYTRRLAKTRPKLGWQLGPVVRVTSWYGTMQRPDGAASCDASGAAGGYVSACFSVVALASSASSASARCAPGA